MVKSLAERVVDSSISGRIYPATKPVVLPKFGPEDFTFHMF
jgi:hypothetical protein